MSLSLSPPRIHAKFKHARVLPTALVGFTNLCPTRLMFHEVILEDDQEWILGAGEMVGEMPVLQA